ncbi:hypothetical protein BGZ83_010897 [Gryganskiella cystojenkinii]|nr:hypothetical protein BGZ83_010897 [Gryganskiella cystojenkinii]
MCQSAVAVAVVESSRMQVHQNQQVYDRLDQLSSSKTRKPQPPSTKALEKVAAMAQQKEMIDSVSTNLINDMIETKKGKRKPGSARITLDDILALKPVNKTKVTPEEFEKIKDTIAQSFNVDQLKYVLRSQNRPSSGKKSILINQIMLFMELEIAVPPPSTTLQNIVEGPYLTGEADHESKVFSSNRRELFFILDAEGDAMRRLEKEKHVRISINIADETYTIRGLPGAIEGAETQIQELVAVTEESWDISQYEDRQSIVGSPSALEEIARRSRTFVSAGVSDNLMISGRTDRDIEEAKRLFDIQLHKPDRDIENLTFTHYKDNTRKFGMFPVYDSATMSLDENHKSFLRMSQTASTAEFAYANRTFVPVQSTPRGIADLEDLKAVLEDRDSTAAAEHFELSAHFGQLLFPNTLPEMTDAPLRNTIEYKDLEQWLDQTDSPTFFSSLPFYKVVSKLPLVGSKLRTIDVEYVQSSRVPSSGISQGPVRLTFELDNDGILVAQGGLSITKRVFANYMMLGQPSDIQFRGEWSSKLLLESPSIQKLVSETSLPFANRLHCPQFFSFAGSTLTSSSGSVSDVGLSGSTHTLKSIMFRTSGVFNFKGLPLVASEVQDQYGLIRKQELKLLPVPLDIDKRKEREAAAIAAVTAVDHTLNETSSELPRPSTPSRSLSPLQFWRDFTDKALDLNRLI